MGKGKRRQGQTRRDKMVFIGAWVPEAVAALISEAANTMGLDRSQLLLRALEEKLNKESKDQKPS